MKKTAAALAKLGIATEEPSIPASAKRFPDGAQYRLEIPSVETPEALSAVLEEADRQKVLLHRASQGSGIMMLTDAELTKMLRIAKDAKIELSLFVGPRAGYDATPQPFTPAGKVIGGALRGGSQLQYAVEDLLFDLAEQRVAAFARAGNVDAFVQRNAAVFDEDHAVGQRHGLLHVVRDQQSRETVALPEAFNQLVHLDAGERVQRA